MIFIYILILICGMLVGASLLLVLEKYCKDEKMRKENEKLKLDWHIKHLIYDYLKFNCKNNIFRDQVAGKAKR